MRNFNHPGSLSGGNNPENQRNSQNPLVDGHKRSKS